MPQGLICELQIGLPGQLMMPSALLDAMHWHPGDTLLARLDGQRVVLEPPSQITQRLRAKFAVIPGHISLVDELIAERREEVGQEEEK